MNEKGNITRPFYTHTTRGAAMTSDTKTHIQKDAHINTHIHAHKRAAKISEIAEPQYEG